MNNPEFLIDYPSSPNGKAYIGTAKRPLMPIKDGHGFEGVLLQDARREFIQCASCGVWRKIITQRHLQACSQGMLQTTSDYKHKYGLYMKQGLVSDVTSLKLTQACLKNKSKKNWFTSATPIPIPQKGYIRSKRQHQNIYGTCPEQLKARTKEFIVANREFPRSSNRGGALYKAIYRQFGSINGALKEYGLPTFVKIGTSYTYTFPNGKQISYNINRFNQREAFFEKMIEECEFFNEENLQTTQKGTGYQVQSIRQEAQKC